MLSTSYRVPLVAIAVVAIAVISFPISADADVLLPGTKSIPFHCKTTLHESCLSLRTGYTVRKGDTLSSIAKMHLGSSKRHGEIAALNPSLDPDRLKIGQSLWLPPRVPDKTKKAPGELWVLDISFGDAIPKPFESGIGLATFYRGIRYAIVPSADRAKFLSMFGRNRAPDVDKLSWVVASNSIQSRNSAPVESKIHETTITVELKRDTKKNSLAATVVKVVHNHGVGPVEHPASAKPPKRASSQAAMGIAALAFGLCLVRARGRRTEERRAEPTC